MGNVRMEGWEAEGRESHPSNAAIKTCNIYADFYFYSKHRWQHSVTTSSKPSRVFVENKPVHLMTV